MTKAHSFTSSALVYLPGHWPGLNALAVVACYWPSYRSVAIRAEPVLAHGNTAVLRIGRRGPDIPPPLILKKIFIYIQMKIFE